MSVYTPTGVKKIYHDSKRTLAKAWLSLFHPTQIAITGSQGKTGTTQIVTALLQAVGPTVRTDLKLDTTFNVPITALHVSPLTKFVVWELGIDHPGEMARHLEIARPTIGVMTGISPVHTDEEHMGSLETLIKEKRKLIEVLPEGGTAILNHDNPHIESMESHTKATVKWYGSRNTDDIWTDPMSIKITIDGTTATMHIKTDTGSIQVSIQTPLIGVHHMSNLMAGFLVLQTIIPTDQAIIMFTDIAQDLRPLRGRMNIEKGPLETVLLNDSLRANPESTRVGLETLNRLEYSAGRKIAVIGEMGELADPKHEHRETGKIIANLNLDYVLCIGPLRKYTIETAIQHGFAKEKIVYAKDVFEAANILRSTLQKGDIWYLKGSLLRNYKRIVQLLNNEAICCQEMLCPYDHCGYDTS